MEILKKNILIRKDDDIQYMIKSTSNLTFFNVLDNETHYFCCRYLKYEYAPKGKIIVRQSNSKNKINSKADLESKLYVLLKGKCGIYKLEDKPQTFQELFTPKRRNSQKPRKTLIEPDADMITEMPVKKSDKPEFVLNVDFGQERNILEYLDFPKNQNKAIFPFTFKNIPFMTRMNKLNKLFNTELVFVKNFEDEDIFCQTSLFGTVFQSSMIIAEEDCHLAVLEKEFFNQVISKIILYGIIFRKI